MPQFGRSDRIECRCRRYGSSFDWPWIVIWSAGTARLRGEGAAAALLARRGNGRLKPASARRRQVAVNWPQRQEAVRLVTSPVPARSAATIWRLLRPAARIAGIFRRLEPAPRSSFHRRWPSGWSASRAGFPARLRCSRRRRSTIEKTGASVTLGPFLRPTCSLISSSARRDSTAGMTGTTARSAARRIWSDVSVRPGGQSMMIRS